MIRKNSLAAYIICFVLIVCSCDTKDKSRGRTKPLISVTIEPQNYFLRAIADTLVDVNVIVPKGNSPETYDPTPQQMKLIAESDAYIKIGYIGFELTWGDRISKSSKGLKTFDSSKGIDYIKFDDNCHSNCNHHHNCNVESHVWASTKNAKIIANNIYKALLDIDGANSESYKANYEKLIAQISHTDSLISDMMMKQSVQKTFMIYHPTLSYFSRDYGLTQISIEEFGKEPTPSHLKKLINMCGEKNVKTIFIQPEFNIKNAETIASETKTNLIKIDPLNYDWHTEMLKIAEVLSK